MDHETIKIKARLILFDTSNGGRITGIKSGYRTKSCI